MERKAVVARDLHMDDGSSHVRSMEVNRSRLGYQTEKEEMGYLKLEEKEPRDTMTAAVSQSGATASIDTNSADTPGQQKVRYKSSTVFHDEEVNEMIHELKELQKTSSDELKSLVFCKSNFAMAIVTREGCRIAFSNGSVYLDIPPKAIKEDLVVFIYRPVHIHLAGDTPEEPGPPPDYIAYAPTVRCGPAGTKLDIPATLQFGHCAVYDPAKGPSGLRAMTRNTETSPWEVMQPEQFDIAANSVKLRLDELSDCTLGFPLKKDS